jgi:diadenosine tetraphosphatase ApaH/serine/threonine PP2A family protein phosphatase
VNITRTGERYGIVADVHANLQAFEAVLAYLHREGVDTIWCLGDVVGYGGDPSACVALTRERCAGTVRGNHDVAVIDEVTRLWFNPHAREAIERQARLLGEDDLAWLRSLPATVDLPGATLAHSGFADPDAFDYVLTTYHAAVEFQALPTNLGFVGHTHVAAAWRWTREDGVEPYLLPERESVPLAGARWIINPGAVGQPRDGDPRAGCAILDTREGSLRYARIEYDVAAAQEAIARAGMPTIEAARLARGI